MTATILIDSREKVNQHITKELDRRGIAWKIQKLNYGDYSFTWNGINYSDKIVIERKGSLDEIIGNFTKCRERFKREFERAKGCRVILLVEATTEHLDGHLYRSRMSPRDLKSFLTTWCNKYQLELKFTDKNNSAELILTSFREFIKRRNDISTM